MGLLAAFATAVVLSLVTGAVLAWRGRRLARRQARGRGTRVGFFLRGQHAPYPRHWRAGRVRSDERPLVFRPWNPFGRRVPLEGLTLLANERRSISALHGEVEVRRLRDPLGGLVEVASRAPFALAVDRALNASAVVAGEPRVTMGGFPSFDRIGDVVSERSAKELWYVRLPGDRTNPGVRARRIAGHAALWSAATVASALIPLGLCWPAVAAAVWFDDARASLATATVVEVDEYTTTPLTPRVLTVTVPGHDGTIEVASLHDARPGDLVAIRYDPSDPSRARRAGEADGVRRGVTFVAVWAAIATVAVLVLLARAVRDVSRARRVRLLPTRSARYAVTRDGTGTYRLLLGDLDDPLPRVAVHAGAALPEDVPVTGTAIVYGDLAGGRRPLVAVGAREVYPDEPAVAVDAQAAVRLAGGGTLR